MKTPDEVIYPESFLIARAVLAGARWVGTCSHEWDQLRLVAQHSKIEGLLEQLDEIKAKREADIQLHSEDP